LVVLVLMRWGHQRSLLRVGNMFRCLQSIVGPIAALPSGDQSAAAGQMVGAVGGRAIDCPVSERPPVSAALCW
jgi:hypothetical protein